MKIEPSGKLIRKARDYHKHREASSLINQCYTLMMRKRHLWETEQTLKRLTEAVEGDYRKLMALNNRAHDDIRCLNLPMNIENKLRENKINAVFELIGWYYAKLDGISEGYRRQIKISLESIGVEVQEWKDKELQQLNEDR